MSAPHRPHACRMHETASCNVSHQDPLRSLTACNDLISSTGTRSILAPPSQGVSSGPIIKACHVMMLSCLGEPLTPCGGSCCNLLKSLISRCMPGEYTTERHDHTKGSECDTTQPNLSCRCRHIAPSRFVFGSIPCTKSTHEPCRTRHALSTFRMTSDDKHIERASILLFALLAPYSSV